jgi:hypothetical protein
MKYWNFTTFFAIAIYLAFIAFVASGLFLHFFGS